ncbi:hypothetical protein ABPG72_019746 [Tetrahymena utriculariae]
MLACIHTIYLSSTDNKWEISEEVYLSVSFIHQQYKLQLILNLISILISRIQTSNDIQQLILYTIQIQGIIRIQWQIEFNYFQQQMYAEMVLFYFSNLSQHRSKRILLLSITFFFFESLLGSVLVIPVKKQISKQVSNQIKGNQIEQLKHYFRSNKPKAYYYNQIDQLTFFQIFSFLYNVIHSILSKINLTIVLLIIVLPQIWVGEII